MENDMSKTHEYFQQELGLDEKTSEAIKILMDEGLLEPLLVDLRNALEAEEYQNTTSGKNFDPHLGKNKRENDSDRSRAGGWKWPFTSNSA